MSDDWNELSLTLTKELKLKKDEGIYFTPKNIVKRIIDYLLEQKKEIKSILEPSCGSCQFIDYLIEKGKSVIGIEKNKEIYNKLKDREYIKNADFLEWKTESKFDLIVGNPPYFVLPKKSIEQIYLSFFDGRPNIYILFIIKSFELLNEDGILAFVLPKNFLNCIYYNNLRRFLSDYKILDIYYPTDKFLETCQEVCVFIIQKTKSTKSNFVVNFDNIVLFKTIHEVQKIKSLIENTTTLYKLGFTISVGKVVWNECKELLTDDSSKTLLIYNGDIKNNKLEIKSYISPKKNYINKKGTTGKMLLVNRGYGNGKYSFNYTLVNLEREYLVENHLLQLKTNSEELYNLVIKSFENKKTIEFIEIVFSTNAINIQEFMYMLPIYTLRLTFNVCSTFIPFKFHLP
jgi:adenine-specific DNA-methyltransferase